MANERRIVELVLKAVGDPALKAMTRDLVAMRKAAEDSQRSLTSISAGVGSMSRLFTGITIAKVVREAWQAVEALAAEVNRATKEMDALAQSISKVGVASADFQKLSYAAKLSGVDAATLAAGLGKLSVSIADVGNKNSAATKALRELGITARSGTLDAMKALADQFAKMPDGAKKSALAVQQFGEALGSKLLPLMNLGSAGLQAMAEEADKLGLVLSNEALAGASMFQKELAKLESVIDADIKKLVGGLAPALVTIAQLLTGAAANSMDFEAAGAALGEMLIAVTAEVVSFGTTLFAYGKAVTYFLHSLGAATQGADAFLSGNLRLGATYESAAHDYMTAAQLYFDNAERLGAAAGNKVHRSYQQTVAQIAADAAKLGQGGADGGAAGAAGGGGRGGGRGREANDNSALSATNQAKLHAAAMRDVAAAINEQREAREKSTEALAAQVAELERAAHPGIAYAEELDRINKLQREGGLSAEAYALAIQKNEEALRSANQALVANSAAQREHDEQQEKNRQQLEKAREEWGFLADAMGRATYDIITGAEKTGQAVKRMVATIISEFIRLAAIKLAEKFLSGPFPGFSLHAKGDAFGASGIVHRPTMFAYGGGIGIAGEAGPEAILPLQRNASGQLGVVANGGGLSVVVNNNVPNAAVQVRETDRGLQIDLIERQLADRVRRGGSALPGALENTYRTGRQASAY